ncbi:MAG: hypothetical protein Q9217_003039 [Psora testacea]
MPPSQLKRLKASLREQGIVGPQKSKKQRKQMSKNGARNESRIQRNGAIQGIREKANPFGFKPAATTKHGFASNRSVVGTLADPAVGRPEVTKGLGEERRRKTLLVEMQRRKKVGGIMDRRFGENDTTMTPEQKALQRFIKEKQRGRKKDAMFDLEDPEADGQLTHFGQSLSFDTAPRLDDFNETEVSGSESNYRGDGIDMRPAKRRRLSDGSPLNEDLDGNKGDRPPEGPKSRKVVMEEVIARSKFHKYERQQAKEDDDDLRAELDKGLPDLFAMLRGTQRKDPPLFAANKPKDENGSVNPDRLALLEGKSRSQADREYDERLRQMAMDLRAKPTVPTLTEEERLQQEAQKLRELEEQRLRRMKGESDDSDESYVVDAHAANGDADAALIDDVFGLGSGLLGQQESPELDVEDEDQFIIDDDLVTNGSRSDSENGVSEPSSAGTDKEEDDVFVSGLLSAEDTGREGLPRPSDGAPRAEGTEGYLAYTYKCSESHSDFLEITKTAALEDLPTIVQRIRALFHPSLASENKAKLGKFAAVLVDHISYLTNQIEHPPFPVLEALIRHAHSLGKTFPEEVGQAFRSHLKSIHEQRPESLTCGDLIILTAIGSIFPTSDHFHLVVTPSMLCMTRYLSQKVPQTLNDLTTGAYLCTLCLQYQRTSKRYIPEVVNYILNAMWVLVPINPKKLAGHFPQWALPDNLRLQAKSVRSSAPDKRLGFWYTIAADREDNDNQVIKQSLLLTHIHLAGTMAEMWSSKSAFCEILDSVYLTLRTITGKACAEAIPQAIRRQAQEVSQRIHSLLKDSLQSRTPLSLHNHRPLAIKTSIPKFEESYNPSKHYDPNRERAELSKLKAEHKKERKGALRELRKDASFIARESLKEKKERDLAYEKKYKRLVAEIQGEEGREANLYEKEKRARKGKR